MDKRKDYEEFEKWIEEGLQITGEWEKTWINGYGSELYLDEMDSACIDDSRMQDSRGVVLV